MPLYRELIDRYGIYPSKDMDQHFIVNERVFDKMIEEAEISDRDVVLEIGGGPGFLTGKLAERAKKVVVVEIDPRFTPVLRKLHDNIELIEGDAVKVRLPPFKKVVSNLPFSISGPFLNRLMTKKWSVAVLVLQKEFAHKLTLKKGSPDSTHLSFLANHYLDVSLVTSIPIGNFYPAPRVEAVMVKLMKKDVKRLDKDVERLARALYQHKRKKAFNALIDSSKALKLPEEELKKAFKARPKYLEKRVYELSVSDFEKLSQRLLKLR